MKLLWAIIIAVSASFAYANPIDELAVDGPISRHLVQNARSPSPFATGYDPSTKRCYLFENEAAPQLSELSRLVALAHEAGHCQALRGGYQTLETTRAGEAFADVYALAWISKHKPELLTAAYESLIVRRGLDRQVDSAYNTLFVLRLAYMSLPSPETPLKFTVELLK